LQEDSGVTEIPEDPAKDPNFSEPEIDRLRAQKDEVRFTKDNYYRG
jgi:hypothetical protein